MNLRHLRLGTSLSTRAIGWVLLEESGKISHRIEGNPLELTLLNVGEGEHVDLLAYSDDVSFAQSQASRDGLTRRKHYEFLEKLVLELRANGRSADIKFVTAV